MTFSESDAGAPWPVASIQDATGLPERVPFGTVSGMKVRNRVPTIAALAAAFLALASCASLKTIDHMAVDEPKGYVCFYCPELDISVFRTEGKEEVLEARSWRFLGRYSEIHVARPPGVHSFVIRHQDYWATVEATVRPEAATYVSVDRIYLGEASNTTYQPGRGTTRTVTTTYRVATSVGTTPIPRAPGVDAVSQIVPALRDEDWGTRLFAIRALESARLNPAMDGIAMLRRIAALDRYRDVRQEALSLLRNLGQEAPPASILFETFEDNDNGWHFGDDQEKKYRHYFDGLGYNVDNTQEGFSGDTIRPSDPIGLSDYDVEADVVWKGGIDDHAFGFVIGSPQSGFYNFCVSRNGGATVRLVRNARVESNPIEWDNRHRAELSATDSFRLKAEVRGRSAQFWANGLSVGTVALDASFAPEYLGMLVYGRQSVVFRTVRISAPGT